MSQVKLGSQIRFVDDSTHAGAVVALNGNTATIRLRGTNETIEAPVSALKTTKGRPAKIPAV